MKLVSQLTAAVLGPETPASMATDHITTDSSIVDNSRHSEAQEVTHPASSLQQPVELSQQFFTAIVQSENFNNLSEVEKQKFLRIAQICLEDTTGDTQQCLETQLLALLNRKVAGNAALLDRDMTDTGSSTLAHLYNIASSPLHNAISEDRRGEMLRSTVACLADPDLEVNQGAVYPDCTQTVLMAALPKTRPAELARYLDELSTTGEARVFTPDSQSGAPTMASTMHLKPWSVQESALLSRNLAESIFQTSASGLVGIFAEGLSRPEVEQLYESITGSPFVRYDSAAGVDKLIKELRAAVSDPDGLNMVSVKWDRSGRDLLHALQIIEVDDDRVVFRNPVGKEFANPSYLQLETVDASRAIYAMSMDEFRRRINYAVLKDKTPDAALGVTPGWERFGQEQGTVFIFTSPLIELMFLHEWMKLGEAKSDSSRKTAESIIAAPLSLASGLPA